MSVAGALLRSARAGAGISQRRLALRAGTSQDAISRIERGAEIPSIERLRRLLLALGEELELGTVRARRPSDGAMAGRLSAAERLRESASWNLAATRLELAGAKARAERDPSTRITRRRQGG